MTFEIKKYEYSGRINKMKSLGLFQKSRIFEHVNV